MNNSLFRLSHSVLLILAMALVAQGQSFTSVSMVWTADQGKGTYKNPILHANYSDPDVEAFTQAGTVFSARPGLWIGAKFGFFALREVSIKDAGTVDLDWIRIEK